MIATSDCQTDDVCPPTADTQQFLGQSAAMAPVKRWVAEHAKSSSPIFIWAEQGSGKEALARFVHQNSPRAARPFIPVDCSALPDTMLEEELFGDAGSASRRPRLGIIRAAQTGTLFLDQIDVMPLPLQSRLVAALRPPAENSAEQLDVRVIASSRYASDLLFRRGLLSKDLKNWLVDNGLRLPPLRERQDDLIPLAEHFLQVQSQLFDIPVKKISYQAAELIKSHRWPGNLHELTAAMQHAGLRATGNTIELDDLIELFPQNHRRSWA